VEVAGSGKVVD